MTLHYRYTDGEPLLLDLRYLAHSGRNDLSSDGASLYKRLDSPSHSMPAVEALLAWRRTHGEQPQFDNDLFRISLPRGTFGDAMDGPAVGFFASAPSDSVCLTQRFAASIHDKIVLAERLSEALVCLHATFHGPLLGLQPRTVLVDGQDRIVLIDLDAFGTLLGNARIPSGDELVPLEFAMPDDACAADGSVGREQDDFALAITLFMLFSGGAHPFALSKSARAARDAGDAAIPERVPNRKQMAVTLNAQILDQQLEWTAEAIEHLRNGLSLHPARLDANGWANFLSLPENLIRPIEVSSSSMAPASAAPDEATADTPLPNWTAPTNGARKFPSNKAAPLSEPDVVDISISLPSLPPTNKRSTSGAFWMAVVGAICVISATVGISRNKSLQRPDTTATSSASSPEQAIERLFVSRPVRVRDRPTSDGSEVLATFTRGIEVSGEWVTAADGETKWLKIEWARGGYAYVWGRNLTNKPRLELTPGGKFGQWTITQMVRVRPEPNEIGPPIDLLSPGATVDVVGEVSGEYLEILLPLGGVGYIQSIGVEPVGRSEPSEQSEAASTSAEIAVQLEALELALSSAKRLLDAVGSENWDEMRTVAKSLEGIDSLRIEPSKFSRDENERGLKLAKQRAFRDALDAFTSAYRASPVYAEARENAIYAAKMMGDYQRVIDEGLPALATRPANASIFRSLGESYAQLGYADLGAGCLQAAYLVSRSPPKTLKVLVELARDGAPLVRVAANRALAGLAAQGVNVSGEQPVPAADPAGAPDPSSAPTPQPGTGDADSGVLQEAPRPLKRVQPQYPLVALQREREGIVVLKVTIGKGGAAEAVEILSERPTKFFFGSSAVNAVSQWEWAPSEERRSYAVTINFKLN